MMPSELISNVKRFWARVDRSGDCWLWTGEANRHGYGRLDCWHDGRRSRILAHRFSLILAGVELGDDVTVRHRCDIPACVNPAHLETGTQSDNIRDAIERGRADMSGLTAPLEKQCRACGATFIGAPNRRYCDEHKRSAA